jgi:hypothetical protein
MAVPVWGMPLYDWISSRTLHQFCIFKFEQTVRIGLCRPVDGYYT